jgi:hypothetical protein
MAQGTKWYNNGKKNIQLKDGDEVPKGFVPGMKRHPYTEVRRKEILDKRKKTNLERYGVENTFQSEEKKEKSRKTNIKRYGVENPMQSEEIKERLRQSNLEILGVEYSWQSEDVKEKAKQTNLERYGTEWATQSDIVKEKIKETNIERYGGYTLQSEELRDKVRQTNLERYGVENPFQSEEIKEKIKQTNIERYGVENPMELDEIKEKMKKTCMERYGCEYASQTKEFRENVKNTCMKKYGVEHVCLIPSVRNFSGSCDSSYNLKFKELLESLGIKYSREYAIVRYAYDFKVGNVLIEIDPFATHNSLWGVRGKPGIEIDYHQKKSRTAEELGYRVIHVFDWDDTMKIIKSFDKTENVYARKCSILNISTDDCGRFLNEYHLQGSCKGQDVRFGLYYNNDLVSVMTFGKPRYNKTYQWELLRYCSSKNIIGGAEKLFKHFIKEHNPESIISYCDRSKFRGNVYGKLGFTLKLEGKPSRHWYSPKETRHITDNLLRQRGYDQLFNEHYGKGTSNEELIIKRGYVPIYDCGQDTYVWSNK